MATPDGIEILFSHCISPFHRSNLAGHQHPSHIPSHPISHQHHLSPWRVICHPYLTAASALEGPRPTKVTRDAAVLQSHSAWVVINYDHHDKARNAVVSLSEGGRGVFPRYRDFFCAGGWVLKEVEGWRKERLMRGDILPYRQAFFFFGKWSFGLYAVGGEDCGSYEWIFLLGEFVIPGFREF